MAHTSLKSEIQERNELFMRAAREGDAAALAGLYTADAWLLPPVRTSSAAEHGSRSSGAGVWSASQKSSSRRSTWCPSHPMLRARWVT